MSNLVFAQPAGCPSGFIGGNQTVNCSSASTVGSPQSSSTAISTPINVSGTTNDNNTVTITQYTTIQLSGSPVGLASGNTVTNYGTLNSNSFTNGYGISFGANGRSSTGGNTVINELTGEIITRGTNANGIYVAPTNSGSTGNTITNIGSVTTYGNSAAAISLMSGSTGSSVVNSIVNTGSLTTSGSGSAYGIEFSSVAGTNTVDNSGTIITSGGAAHAINITSTRNAVGITNSGTITASGAGANGVNISGAASITNSGTIGTTSGLAINFGGALPTGTFNTLVINNGSVINGGIAFNVASTRETLTFNGYSNSGFNNAITGLNIVNSTNSSSVTMNSSEGYELVSGQVAVDATSSLTINAVVKDQVSPVIASSITKTGDGVLTLSGANTYTGGTSIIAGSIAVGNNAALGTGDLAMAGGTILQAASAVTLANNISVTGPSTINTNSNDLGLTGNISGTGSVTKSGLGVLTLSGANAYTGGTTVSAGTLVGNTTSLQGDILNNAALQFNQSTSGSYSGVMSGTGTLDILGGGVVTLSGENTYSGQTTIGIGSALALANSGSIANSRPVVNNGTFDIQQKTTNTNLAGNYVQSSTGTLKMGLTTSNVEKLVITGTASLSGNLYVNATPGRYNAGRYTLITTAPSGRSGTFTSFTSDFDTALSNYRLTYDGSDVYLLLDSSFTEVDTANTVQSVQINAAGLANIYNQQVAAYQVALTYDCSIYDKNNLCISVGGRYAYAGPSPSANQQAGLVIVGYKPSKNFRIGAFADQSISNSMPSGFSQSNVTPMWGLFAKWYMNPDETGLGIQASGVASSSTLNITRTQLSNTEAGAGATQFTGQGYQLTANYHQPVTDSFSVLPYVGLRYTRVNTSAYTENSSASVTLPISYNSMTQNTFSAIGGIGFRVGLAENLTGTASIGIQQNLKYSMSNYQATSAIVGLESFSVAMPGNVSSMATATAGLIYEINKRERLGLNVLWQQQPFIATNTTTALATYTIGF
ncbi:beta strand repeat-containing protein [Polynucleobacter hirudinilacicola]|uniref:beta strand repeat-containing protein n=1 Tax=Polynucleobacter hirudinilacicola TaxID=1743166 RepID=UPI00137479CF|nr:autotransporter-associated beta strand repeat-containing protein [Polynucleobacter hirudinilacicola]